MIPIFILLEFHIKCFHWRKLCCRRTLWADISLIEMEGNIRSVYSVILLKDRLNCVFKILINS